MNHNWTKHGPELLRALKHAHHRLNMIPHNYENTDFRFLREVLEKVEGKKIFEIRLDVETPYLKGGK